MLRLSYGHLMGSTIKRKVPIPLMQVIPPPAKRSRISVRLKLMMIRIDSLFRLPRSANVPLAGERCRYLAKSLICLLVLLALSSASYAGEWINIPPNKWKSTIRDWHSIEKKLKIKVEEAALTRNDPVRNWASYNFQYTYVIKNGKKAIYINGFCQALGIQWRTQRVYVKDGGSCFFQAYYDPASKNIYDVYVNGQA